jgi:hypothetical protein
MKTVPYLPILLSLALAGCSTPAPEAPDQPSIPAFRALYKGQPAAEVKARVGEPAEIRPFPVTETGLAAEVWVYRRVVAREERQVPIRTRDVPAVNPITGLAFTVNEPVYETQSDAIIETVELLMVEQQLVQRKSRRHADTGILFR